MVGATPSQAWAILARHARDEIANLRLQELMRDNDRVSSLVAVYNTENDDDDDDDRSNNRTLIVDLSRQRMTDTTLNHLLHLAASKQLKQFTNRIAWGQNNPNHPVHPSVVTTGKKSSSSAVRFQESKLATDAMAALQTEQHQSPPPQQHEPMPSMHLALRVPSGKGYEMFGSDGKNVLSDIHRDWHRIERLADSVRRGLLKGSKGEMLRDVVIVGRGTAVAALKFIYAALRNDEQAVIASRFGLADNAATRTMRSHYFSSFPNKAARRMRFLTSVDPVAAASVVSDLDPGSTLVISIAVEGNEETGLATKLLKSWLLNALGNNNKKTDHILAKHMILITGNDRIASFINKPESVYVIPEHSRCEAFTSFSVATLLPLSVVFGWSIVEEFLAGGHDLDTHFVDTNPRHNLPILLALTDVWNDTFLNASARAVIPFTEAFTAWPKFAGVLEAQTCGRMPDKSAGHTTIGSKSCSSIVIDGGVDGSFDRSLYQSDKIVNSELLMAMDSQIGFNTSRSIGAHGMDGVYASQDALMCSLFAHADELAFGSKTTSDGPLSPASTSSNRNTTNNSNSTHDISEGNRPSLLLMCGKLDAFTCGQLVALAEHRATVKAYIWGIDPFVREIGSSLHLDRTDELMGDLEKIFATPPQHPIDDDEGDEEGDETRLNLSTKTLLGHYANLMREERTYTG